MFGLLTAVLLAFVYVVGSLVAPVPATAAVTAHDKTIVQPAAQLAWPGYGSAAIVAPDYPGASASHGSEASVPIASITKIITAPAFDAKEFERVRGDRLTSLELRRDRPREVAQLVLSAVLYGMTTPYGHPASGQKDEFKDLALADLQTFYKAHYNPAAMTLVVAGDVDAAALKAKLDAGLGAWKPTGVKRPVAPKARPARVASRLQLVDRPGAEQSDVRIGLVGPDRKDRRYFAFEVMTSTLQGLALVPKDEKPEVAERRGPLVMRKNGTMAPAPQQETQLAALPQDSDRV